MKFLVLSSEYPPQCGGAGNYIFDLIKGLVSQGHEVELITRKFYPVEDHYKHEKLKIHRIKNIPKFFIFLMWLKTKDAYRNDFNFILLNDVGATFVGALFFNDEMKKKSICFSHGQETFDIIDKKLKWYEKFISLKKKYFYLLRDCKIIIAVSEDQKEKIIKACSHKFDLKNKFKVIYNSYNSLQFYPDNIKLDEFKSEVFNIVSVSRIVKQKGYDLKFEVMNKLFEENIYFHWYIIGDGSYKNEFELKISNSKIKDCVTFLGKINRDDLRKYYSNADLFILLSEFRESFGLVYLEAIACGCPAVGLDNGGVREVIQPGINGFLINYSDINQIVSESINNIKYIEKFPLEKDKIVNSVIKFRNSETYNNFIKLLK